jgi:hypothetical protein
VRAVQPASPCARNRQDVAGKSGPGRLHQHRGTRRRIECRQRPRGRSAV